MLTISNSIHAEYLIKIPLDPLNVSIEDAEVTGNIKLDPTEIKRGESSNIVWDYTYADKISIEDVGDYNSKVGMTSVSPLESTTYNVLVTHGTKYKNETLYLNVIQPDQNITFNADSYRIGVGTSTNLNWNVINSPSVSIDNGIGAKPLSGKYVISPTTNTTYTLTAKGYTGISDKIETVDVVVVPNATINSFLVDTDKITIGETATFSWDINNAESVTLNDETVNKTSGTKPVVFTTAGAFPYQLMTTSLSGVTNYSSTKTVNVYNVPIIANFTVNGQAVVDVSPSADLSFAWGTTYASSLKLNNSVVTGTNTTLTAKSTTGSTVYTLNAANEANRTVSKTVTVNVIGDPVIDPLTAPSPVFSNAAFTLGWSATGASKYTVKANNANSGLSTTEEDVGMTTTKSITPTTDGTYTYTVNAYNTANAKKAQTKSVIVEADPSITALLVNGSSSISVAPNTALSFTSSGLSSGATLVGRDNSNTSNASFPTAAPATAGTTTYYGTATKTLNGITKFGTPRSASVTVVAAPTIGTITAPTNVFANTAFTTSWTGTNVASYTIKSNNASSGVATTETSLSTATSSSITPTVAGTYTYTLTATNSVGVTAGKTFTVTVEDDPSLTSLLVNGVAGVSVSPNAALSFTPSGLSSGATLAGRNSSNNANSSLPTVASASAGTTTYYGAPTKTLNGITKFGTLKSVNVIVVAAPTIGTITAPTNVFANAAFTASWSGTDIASYTIKSNNASSGIATTDTSLSTATSSSITPTVAGTYTYTLTATNSVGVVSSKSFTVTVEADPDLTSLLVNGVAGVSVAPNAALSFTPNGLSSGATLAGRNSSNNASSPLPTVASASAGTTTYYGAPTKTLNGITKFGTLRSVNVIVVAAPTIGTITAPTNVFANAAFTASWSGTDIASYAIKSNNATSGVATTDTSLSTATSRLITPTAAGTYTYTLTATNSVGVVSSKSFTVTVEADPTFNSFVINGSTNIAVASGATLTYTGAGISSGAFYQARNAANDTNVTNPSTAASSAGTYTYYMSAAKTLNGVNRYSALRSAVVRVVNSPIIGGLTANPAIVDAGQSSTLTFSTAYSNYNTINGVDMGSSPTYVVNPTTTTTYTLVARNEAGQTASQSVTVTVQNWSATTPVYGAWTNVAGRVQYNCGAWTPDGNTTANSVTANTTFTQTASCLTDQTRTRQDRLISSATGAVKNNGAVVNESQTITQTASRPYSVVFSGWSNSSVTSCASWTPGTQYYRKGQTFTQTGTNCTATQTSTVTQSYNDHITGAYVAVSTTTRSQTVSGVDGGTRTAIGTYCVRCDN